MRVWRSSGTNGLANENITQQAFGELRLPAVQMFTQGPGSPGVVELRSEGAIRGAPASSRLTDCTDSLTAQG